MGSVVEFFVVMGGVMVVVNETELVGVVWLFVVVWGLVGWLIDNCI